MRSFLVLALLLLTAPLAGAEFTPSSSRPSNYFTFGGLTFFAADDGETGRELWRTDGTPGGTYRLTDACPLSCSSFPTPFYFSGGRSYFFRAFDELEQPRLWVSGGTPATTFQLTAARVPLSAYGRWLGRSGLLLFSADDGVHGLELWRSDGTPGGTYQVTDLRPGLAGSNPRNLILFKDQIYFVADDGRQGPILWKSDGTPQGTQAVRDPVPGSVPGSAGHSAPESLRVAGDNLFFVAPTPARGVQLWRSDGTTGGTAPLTDLRPNGGVFSDSDLAILGNRLFFVADDGRSGQELWVTDGTKSGTRSLTRFTPADAFQRVHESSFYFFPPFPAGNRLVFPADDGIHGAELWATNGTPAGTTLLKDVCPGSCSGAKYALPTLGNQLLFPGYNSVRGWEPWITDGTPGGTHLIKDLCRGSCSSDAYALAVTGGRAFLVTQPVQGPSQLWSTDGTAGGTILLPSFPTLDGGALLGSSLIFSADDGVHGAELWKSDGTSQGTGLLADLNTREP